MTEAIKPVVCLQEWLRRVHISHVMSPSTMSPKYTVLYIVNIVYSIQNIRNNTKILQEWLRRVHISHVMSPSQPHCVTKVFSARFIRNNTKVTKQTTELRKKRMKMTRRELGVCIVCLYGRGEPSVYGQLHLSGWVPARAAQSLDDIIQTSQELRMLSSVTINCQITKIVMNSDSQLSEL